MLRTQYVPRALESCQPEMTRLGSGNKLPYVEGPEILVADGGMDSSSNRPLKRSYMGLFSSPKILILTGTTVTPEGYSKAINYYAPKTVRQTLYPGNLLTDLAMFLKGSALPTRSSENIPEKLRAFATIYTQDDRGELSSESYDEVDNCRQAANTALSNSKPQIIFLKGHLCPRWICSIGSLLGVDPEFWRWHLRYRYSQSLFATAPLPSVLSNCWNHRGSASRWIGSMMHIYTI